MSIVAVILICVAALTAVYFRVPFSKTRTEFNRMAAALAAEADADRSVLREEDTTGLPEPVRNHLRFCGFIGKPKAAYMKITYRDVDFLPGGNKPRLRIDYTQYNRASAPERIAYIESSMYGIPFEGLDCFVQGAGSMKGVLAKQFTLFNQKGSDMARSGLVTWLSECLLLPGAALWDDVAWEPVDGLHARATLPYDDMRVGGVFTFGENGEMLSFQSEDRMQAQDDGTSIRVKWSVVCGDYRERDGLKTPTAFQAIWHYEDGDSVYFDGKGVITYE